MLVDATLERSNCSCWYVNTWAVNAEARSSRIARGERSTLPQVSPGLDDVMAVLLVKTLLKEGSLTWHEHQVMVHVTHSHTHVTRH